MTVIKINAITVPADSGSELGRRFAQRAGAVDGQPGFEGFELLEPTDGRTTWLVITRWRDEESFEAWMSSNDFARAHAGTAGRSEGSGEQVAHGQQGATGADAHGAPAEHGTPAGAHGGPVGVSAELWSYTVSTVSDGQSAN